MASKIVVLGAVNCQLQAAFTKLAKLQAKQNFAFAIIVGNLFGDCSTEAQLDEISALLNGNIGVPLPTYFSVGDLPLPTRIVEKIEADDEVCPNLYFLGKRGTLKTSEGIRIAALGGTVATADSKTPQNFATGRFQTTYTEPDARSLFGTHSADILITNQWPKGILTGSKVGTPKDESVHPAQVQCLADVCGTLKPKYHFTASDAFFYEREPFFHMPTEDNPAKPLTRFISLATFGSRQKSMYAFSLDPKAEPPLTIPAGVTASPLSRTPAKRKGLPSQQESFRRFAPADEGRPRKRQREKAPPPGPDQCFFCLSNPNIATHLITSIGEESYLTTAKGPLPPTDFFSSLGFPGHMLIIPFTHSPTLNSIPEPGTRETTYKEMQRYRSALHKMVMDRSGGKLGAVTWEVSRSGGIHTHWQFLPVPIDMIRSGLVDAAFKVEAENLKYPRFTTIAASESRGSEEAGDFFRLWVWNPSEKEGESTESHDVPGEEKMLMLELSQDFRFDLQFGRRVMAKLLELDKRMDWKDATQTAEEEEADAEAFKKAFEKYDFA
ncbi:hypothetical protein N7456_012024 [Penicillium angulare]|uniref:Cwf19-like C-terminal domain-containing protein n=1 Tax=Penicillium angulare TaxID=116970 RepID=A0A9W9K0B8_9EURO|nr:hypothetical protein N7456_012024 [Penicillium angulare]